MTGCLASFRCGDRRTGSISQQLVQAIIAGAFIRLLGMLLTLLVGIQLARYLGPAGFGVYGTVMAICAIAVVPLQLGLPQLVTRDLAKAGSQRDYVWIRAILTQYAFCVAAISLLVTVLGLICLNFWPFPIEKEFADSLCWGFVGLPFMALNSLGIGIIRGFHQTVSAQAYDALIRPALLSAMLLIAYWIFGELSASTAILFQVTLTGLILAVCVCHIFLIVPIQVYQEGRSKLQFQWATTAAPMFCTEVLRVIDGQYPVLLLGVLAAPEDVGIFRVALAAVALVGLPAALMNTVIMSQVAHLHEEGEKAQLQKIVAVAAMAVFSITALMTFGAGLVGRPLLGLMFGADYLGAWIPLVVMSAAYAINGFFGASATVLNMCGGEKAVAHICILGLAVGMCTTLLLFPLIGITSVAWGFCGAELIKGFWMNSLGRRLLGLRMSVLAYPRLLRTTQ